MDMIKNIFAFIISTFKMKKSQWVQLRLLTINACKNILNMIENRKEFNSSSKFKFKT